MADGITWSTPATDSSGSGSGITWSGDSSDSSSAPQSPQTDFSPSGFASQYSDAIQNAASQLDVPASAIAGQWGLETGWGKSVIPGTNNLGNIKSTAATGQGVAATDNATGSTDAYQQFDNPMDFSNAYVNLIQNNYPKAVGAQDPTSFATALKQGGYAQDPKYVSSLTSAANTASKALAAISGSSNANASETPQGQQSSNDFNSWLQQNSSGATPTTPSVSPGGDDFNDWMKQNGQMGGSSTMDNIWNTIKGIPSAVGNGISQSVQHPVDFAKSAAGSIWNPITNALSGATVAEASQAPNNNINVTPQSIAAQQAVSQSHNITPDANTNQTAWNAGKFVGQTAAAGAVGAFAPEIPMLEGGGLLARAARMGAVVGNNAVQGGIQGGVTSAMNGDSAGQIAANTGLGAAGGAVLGPVFHGVSAAAKPIIGAVLGTKGALAAADQTAAQAGTATGAAFSPTETAVAGKVADAINADGTPQTAQSVAAEMAQNADSAVPGYQRTAAETTNSPTIQAIQQGLDKSDNNGGLAARANANAEANTSFLQQGATSDADLAAQKQAFQDSQNALAAQGNREMPAVTAAQAGQGGLYDAPAMQRTLARANVIAQNDGSNVIQQAFDAPNNAIVDNWNNNIAGSAGKTAQIETARSLITSPMYNDALSNAAPIAIDHQTAALLNTPAVSKALKGVETYKANMGDDTPAIQNVPALSPNDGQMHQQSIHPADLNLAKMAIDDHIQSMGNPSSLASADKWQRGAYIDLRNQLNSTLEDQVPGFKQANVEYAKRSDQMAESNFLTNPNMVDAMGKMRLNELDASVKEIQAGQANNNPNDPTKLIAPSKLAQLIQARDDLAAMKGKFSAQGLQGDAYGYLRQAAEKDPVAAQVMQQHLSANSPAYKQFYNDQEAGTQAIQQQENYNNLVKKFDARADGNTTWQDTRNLGTQYQDYSPENVARLNAVRDNQQRFANRTEQVAGSDTASNLAKRQGFDNMVAGQPGNGVGDFIAGENGQRILRTGIGPVATLAGAKFGGKPGALLGDWFGDQASTGAAKVIGRMLGGDSAETLAAKTAANRSAAENLLLNPKRLSDAIGAVDTATKTKNQITQNLMSKVKGVQQAGGLLGAITAGQVAGNSNKKQ
jgi:hypothetical protein